MASEKITNIVEELKTLSIIEVAELVKAIEEEFGVSAAAAERTNGMLSLPMLALPRWASSRLSVKSPVLV